MSTSTKRMAFLSIDSELHPEFEIDKVTIPKGITISGLSEMEHQGFTSSIVRAIVKSANKIENIFDRILNKDEKIILCIGRNRIC